MRERKSKSIESPLLVYRSVGATPVQIGELNFLDDTGGQFIAEFRYAQSYYDRPDAYAIDPLNLPLSAPGRVFSTASRYHVLGSLFDAAPDAWGRRIIMADQGVSQSTEKNIFLKGKGVGVGEIYFTAGPLEIVPATPKLARIAQIEALAAPIRLLDEASTFDAAWKDLLVSSWDIGGARPKAIVRDEDGEEWIAKFPRKHESFDRQRAEWANLEMAADIGMQVPRRQLIETAHGAVLLVKRFDRASGERRHYLSAAALISPSPSIDKRDIDAPVGQAVFSYARIADVIQRISSNPSQDLQELFARMVFNVMSHNVDDHLKNIGFLRDPGMRDTYRLAPLFDVVTQEGSAKHMLRVGIQGRTSTLGNALSDIRRMRIKPAAATAILSKARAVFDQRAGYYRRAGLGDTEVAAIERCLIWLHDDESDQ